MKPFDLKAAMAGDPIVTGCGKRAKFIAYTPECAEWYRVFALVEGTRMPYFYSEDGRCLGGGPDCPDNLHMAPVKRTVYVNFYGPNFHGGKGGCCFWYETEDAARAAAGSDAIEVAVPVEIEI